MAGVMLQMIHSFYAKNSKNSFSILQKHMKKRFLEESTALPTTMT